MEKGLTQHFGDVWLNVHVLQVCVGVGVVHPEGGVELDGDPHPVPDPGHLPDLGLLPRVGVERVDHGHGPGVDHEDLVPVAAPHARVDLDHTPDAVVGLPQVQEVIVDQVPLTVGGVTVKDGDGAIGKSCQYPALDMTGKV